MPAALGWRLGIPTAIVLLCLIAFIPALAAGFVHWDDDDLLFSTTRYQEISPENLAWMWTTSYAGHFQPLTWLSYSLDFSWTGYAAFGYHLTNVVLHLVNTVLFYLLALRLIRRGVSSRWHPKSKALYLAAGFAAALFSVHPLRVESVAWIAERRDVLCGVFYLLSLLCYVAYASARVSGEQQPRVTPKVTPCAGLRLYYVAALVCFVLSLLAKASAVMLPVVFFVLDVYPLRRLGAGGRWRRSTVIPIIVEKLPFFIVALAISVRAIAAQREGGALYPLFEYDSVSRLAQACYGLAFYVWKTVVPVGLGPLYPLPARDELLGGMLLAGAATLLGLVGIALAIRRRFPIVPAALCVYAAQLLPVSGLFQSGPQLVADRYSYLACLGFAMLGGAGLLWLLNSRHYWTHRNTRAVAILTLSVVLSGLAHATFNQAAYWDHPLTLWKQGVEVSPYSSIAHVNYADALAEAGEVRLAIQNYDRALRIQPRDPIATSHLGRALIQVGDLENAARMFTLTVRLDPDRTGDYIRLAETLVDLNRPDAAAGVLRDRARRAPNDLSIVAMLADLLATHREASVRDGEEAVRWATHAHRARGARDAPTMLVLATALAEAGQFARAMHVGNAALEPARAAQDERLVGELQRRIALFEARRPYHYDD